MQLTLEHITKSYTKGKKRKNALEDFTLTLTEGVYGLLGPNGAGKSTLINIITGIIGKDSGSIAFSDGGDNSFLSHLGFMPQGMDFYRNFTAKDYIKYIMALKKYSPDNADEYALSVLDRVNLHSDADKKIGAFSGGMKQRLGIAQAIVGEPKVLIFDEPTAGLDVEARNEILDLLRDYAAEDENRTILITSHIASDLEHLCDDIYLIHGGKQLLHEETDVILEQYGLIKADEAQYAALDKEYLLGSRKEPYGYACLTNDRKYYEENVPGLVVERAGIDEVILMMTGGKRK